MPEGVLGGFGWYFSKVRMNPWDFGDISVLGVELWNTLDGGETWERMGPEWWTYEVHADKHDLQWVGPNELILATDGGAYRSTDHGETWQDIEALPIGQFYHVTHIPWAPGWYTAGAQDNGTTTGNASVAANWTRDRGGDGFTALYHPEDPFLRVATYSTPTSLGASRHGMKSPIGTISPTGWIPRTASRGMHPSCFTQLSPTWRGAPGRHHTHGGRAIWGMGAGE